VRIRKISALAMALGLMAGLSAGASAKDVYPTKPITLIIPFAPGGANDEVARLVARAVGTKLGMAVVADNKPGAGGVIGSEFVAKSAPDGYTLLLTSSAIAINKLVYPKLPFDPTTDFAPVIQLTEAPYVAVVRAKFPAKTLEDLIDLARHSPGRYTYASSGNGSAPHLAGAMMADMAHVTMQHVPYKGGGPALIDVMRGDISVYFSSMDGALPQLNAGTVRALAVTTTQRSASLPDVPTVAQAGLPGYEVTGWYGILAPAHTPPAVVERLNQLFGDALREPAVAKQLKTQGENPVGQSPQSFGTLIKHDVDKYTLVGRHLKID
jgi:tripartite-type tricarboxylate transporter receptor subunit TctC